MVKRITVSVPDELYEKMRAWSSSINFSKEFQRHMRKVVEQKEELNKLLKGEEEMAKIIERLRGEKIESIGDHTQIGFQDGYEWAKGAQYSHLKNLLEWDPRTGLPEDEEVFEFIKVSLEEDEYISWEDWDYKRQNEYNNKYLNGFKEGMEAFWNKVKDLI